MAQELPQDLIRFGAPRIPLMQQQDQVGDGRRVQVQDLQGLAPEVRSTIPNPPLDLRPLGGQEGPDAVAARSVEVPELLLVPEGPELPERREGQVRHREPLEGVHRRLRRGRHPGVCGGTGGPEGRADLRSGEGSAGGVGWRRASGRDWMRQSSGCLEPMATESPSARCSRAHACAPHPRHQTPMATSDPDPDSGEATARPPPPQTPEPDPSPKPPPFVGVRPRPRPKLIPRRRPKTPFVDLRPRPPFVDFRP